MTIYKTAELKSLLIGADAIVDLKIFNETTLHSKYFRNLVNRSKKLGFKFETYSPPHSKKLIIELQEVSDSWKSLPHRKEWSFLTGRFDEDYLSYVDLYVARDESGRVQAFANGLPDYKPKQMTIDLMRHGSAAPPNSIDFLFIALMEAKYLQGYRSFNLGMSPLDAEPFIKSRAERLVNKGYRFSDSFIGFRGLHRFKAKYQPNWEPRYVIYQKGPTHLLRIGLAVFRLLMG
jgi:phosphatidylglycerol lysyltransferase